MSYLDGQMLDNCFCNVLVWGMNYNCSYGKVKLRCDRRNQSPNPHIGRAVSKLQPSVPVYVRKQFKQQGLAGRKLSGFACYWAAFLKRAGRVGSQLFLTTSLAANCVLDPLALLSPETSRSSHSLQLFTF